MSVAHITIEFNDSTGEIEAYVSGDDGHARDVAERIMTQHMELPNVNAQESYDVEVN